MTNLQTVLKTFIYFFTFSILIFSPLPFGSVEPWARYVLQLQAFILFILWLFWSMYSQSNLNLNVKTYLPLLIFILICLFQIIPLPDFILGSLSQESLAIWKKNQSVLASIGFNSKSSMFTISLYPHATWIETLLLLSYVAFGFVIARNFTTVRKIKLLLIPILGVSLLEATYGIYQYAASGAFATGTFVNRNHFAGFLEMTFPVGLGYVLSLGEWHDNKRTSFFENLTSSDNIQKQILLLFLLGMILLALFLSGSRMGIFSALLSLVFFYLAYSSFHKSNAKKSGMILFALAVAVVYGLWIGIYPVFERFLQIEAQAPGRILVWKDMLNIIKDFTIFGTGFGTFSYVYPLYKDSLQKAIVYKYAHNDYLQLLVETGAFGFLSLVTAIILFLSHSLKNLTQLSQDKEFTRFFLSIGVLSGIVALLIHSLADFNLHIPSNALYFAFLIGFLKAIQSKAENPKWYKIPTSSSQIT